VPALPIPGSPLAAGDRVKEGTGARRQVAYSFVCVVQLRTVLVVIPDEELAALLDSYGREHSAEWSCTTALLDFRRGGDTPEAEADLRQALTVNAHVPAYLLGRKKLPRVPAPCITMGREDEAQEYVRRHAAAWTRTAGAAEWLAKHRPDDKRTSRRR
jgi:hypothetical protein